MTNITKHKLASEHWRSRLPSLTSAAGVTLFVGGLGGGIGAAVPGNVTSPFEPAAAGGCELGVRSSARPAVAGGAVARPAVAGGC